MKEIAQIQSEKKNPFWLPEFLLILAVKRFTKKVFHLPGKHQGETLL